MKRELGIGSDRPYTKTRGIIIMSKFSENHSDYAFAAVPAEKRQNFFQMAVVWTGFVLTTSNLVTGSIAGSALPFGQAILAILIGNVLLTVLGMFQSRAGCETNLSTCVLARYALGTFGAKLLSLVFIINLVGWYGVANSLSANVAASFIPLDERLIAFIFSVVFMSTALYGYKGLKILSSVAVPLVSIISVIGLYKVIGENGGLNHLMQILPSEPRTFSFVVFITFGTWISGAIMAPDISRYAKNKKSAYGAVAVGFFLGNSLLMIVGAVLAMTAGTWDFAGIFQVLGLGLVGLLFLTFIQWTTSDNGLYSAGLALSNLFELKSKFWATLGAGIVGTILATMGIYSYIINYIVILGSVIIPVTGILIADYQFFRTKYEVHHELIKRKISIPALIAWVVGFIVAKFTIWGYPAVNSLLVAGSLHYILTLIMGQGTEAAESKKLAS